jgi:hypothetical protein
VALTAKRAATSRGARSCSRVLGASIIIGANGSAAIVVSQGGIGPGQDHPQERPQRFRVRFDLLAVSFGDPLIAEVEAANGQTWVVPVVSVGGAPAVLHLIGGDTDNVEVPPAEALAAIRAELGRVFEQGEPHERAALQAVGFRDGVRRPTQPRRSPDSDANLAVRARRALQSVGGAVRVTATERDAVRRARARGIHREGRLTEFGESVLEEVDRAKIAILEALRDDQRLAFDKLVERQHGTSEDALKAAVLDLELHEVVVLAPESCPSCGSAHMFLRLR